MYVNVLLINRHDRVDNIRLCVREGRCYPKYISMMVRLSDEMEFRMITPFLILLFCNESVNQLIE